jgi:glycerol-3-phosphate acyltransferase PlsY
VLSLVLPGVLGYIIGSFPTAYLLVRWKSNMDVRQVGSGNVGTLNSYQVTGSKGVGAAVLLLDLMKGAGAVLCAPLVMQDGFGSEAAGAVGAVLGHNFPIWLGFKGGRGLATAAGAMLVIGWMLVAVWGTVWVLGKVFSDNVNIRNVIASIVSLMTILIAPPSIFPVAFGELANVNLFKMFAVVMFAIILVRHVEPVREFLKERNTTHNAKETRHD